MNKRAIDLADEMAEGRGGTFMKASVRVSSGMRGVAALLLLGACASERSEPLGSPPTGVTSQALDAERGAPERGGEWSVAGVWREAPGLQEFSAANPLTATLTTTTDRKVDVIVEGRGMDRRVIRRVLRTGLALRTGIDTTIAITPADVPLQSIGGVSQLKIKAQYKGDGGETVTMQVGPGQMYVTHSVGYGQAWATSDNVLAIGIAAQRARQQQGVVPVEVLAKANAYASDPASDVALGRQLLTMAQTEGGRYRDPSGAWVDYAGAQAAADYVRGGAFPWPSALYDKVRLSTRLDPGTFTPIPKKTIKVCATLRPDFRDNGQEKYLRDEDIPSGKNFATIYGDNDTRVLFSGLLDASGCAPVVIDDDAPCFGVEVKTDVIGSGATKFVVKPATTFKVGICFQPGKILGVPSGYTVNVGNVYDDPVVRTTVVAQRIATMPDPGFFNSTGSHVIESDGGCQKFPVQGQAGKYGEACYYEDIDSMSFGVALHPVSGKPLSFHTTADKFVVGHELGHMQQHWSTGSVITRYPLQDGTSEPACKCDSVVSSNRGHCLNSREYLSTAQSEGWGHFFSAKVMNDFATITPGSPGAFGYYKELWTDAVDGSGNHIVKRPPLQTAVSPLAAVKWRNRHCPAEELGTEWDWLTFLTTLHTQGANKWTMAEIADVWQRACGASGVKCDEDELTWAATSVLRKDFPPDGGPDGAPVVAENVPGKPVDTAAKARFGVASAKYVNWISQAAGHGVSNDLNP